jgi:hypothetical protein
VQTHGHSTAHTGCPIDLRVLGESP